MTPSAFIFPGFGAQHLRMIEALPDPAATLHYLDAAEAAIGRPVTSAQSDGPEAAIGDVEVGSALVYLSDWAWGSAMLHAGVEPVALAGYGVGELAALAVGRAISPGAGLALAIHRSRAIRRAAQDSDGATSVVVGLPPERVEAVLQGARAAWVSAVDGPLTVRIGGSHTVLASLEPALHSEGALRVTPVMGQGAVGTPYLSDGAATFAALLEEVEILPPHFPVVGAASAQATTDPSALRAALVSALLEPTRWTDVTATLRSLGAGVLVECGPGGGLASMAASAGYESYPLSAVGVEHTVSRLRSMV